MAKRWNDILDREHSWLWRYGMAVAAAALAYAVRLAFNTWLGDHAPYVTFMAAVAVSVWLASGQRCSLPP